MEDVTELTEVKLISPNSEQWWHIVDLRSLGLQHIFLTLYNTAPVEMLRDRASQLWNSGDHAKLTKILSCSNFETYLEVDLN